jgi:membrane associated rhomboid family serine protease
MPESADIVIVGGEFRRHVGDVRFGLTLLSAGIAGALLAYHMAHPEDAKSSAFRSKRIVVLEGGEVASSASE